MRIIEREGIEYGECQDCRVEWPIDMLESCIDCDEGPFCSDCLEAHEDEYHTLKCKECGEPIEIDPPCPICNAEICDDCFKDHIIECKFVHELGKEQRRLTQFPLFFCV